MVSVRPWNYWEKMDAAKLIIKENFQWLTWTIAFSNPEFKVLVWNHFINVLVPVSMDTERLGREIRRKSIREATGVKYIISYVSTISSTTLHIHFWVNMAFLKTLLQLAIFYHISSRTPSSGIYSMISKIFLSAKSTSWVPVHKQKCDTT